MPLYDYSCTACQTTREVMRGIKDNSEVICTGCGSSMSRVLRADTVMGHVRGSTIGKAYKESKLRRKKNAELGVKQMERHGGATRLVPNVGGEEVGSWREATLLAKDQGKDTSKYSANAEVETHTNNSRGIDERAWRKAKEVAARA